MGSGWVSLLCHVVWGFGVGSEVGWAASCRHTHQKKSGATTLNGSAELRRLRALGGPKLAAPPVTHILPVRYAFGAIAWNVKHEQSTSEPEKAAKLCSAKTPTRSDTKCWQAQ